MKRILLTIALGSALMLGACDTEKPVLGNLDFWANSYFSVSSPYAKNIFNPSKEEYSYAYGSGISTTDDGGYLVSGVTRTFSIHDALALKLNGKGQVEKGVSVIGGAGFTERKQNNHFSSGIQATEGGYLLGGTSTLATNGGGSYGTPQMFLVKLSTDGALSWSKSYATVSYDTPADYSPGTPSIREFLHNMIPVSSGGYLLVGTKLVKVDGAGNVLAARAHNLGTVYSTRETQDGGFLLASSGNSSNRITKIDANLNLLWSREVDVEGLPLHLADLEIVLDAEGNENGLIVVGRLQYISLQRSSDWLVIRLDQAGNLLWSKNLGGSTYDADNLIFSDEQVKSILRTPDGNFVLGGVSESFDSELNYDDPIVVKINPEGDVLWTKRYQMAADSLTAMTLTAKGFAFTGDYHRGGDNRVLVVSCDENGNVPEHGSQLQVIDVAFQTGTPALTLTDKSADTILESFTPVVSNTGSNIHELSPDRRRH